MKKIENKRILITILGTFIGIISYVLLFGIETLNFTNDTWLLAGERDQRAHYIGWEFFRNSAWKWPIGMMDGIIAPRSISIIYTDSVPWLAVFFKIFRGILPETFQYFGLWGLMCFSLQGALAGYIVSKYVKNIFSDIALILLFVLSPTMVQRLYYHSELAAHFIILMGLIPWIEREKMNGLKKRTVYWSILFSLAAGIHIYFIPMLVILMTATTLFYLFQNKKWLKEVFGWVIPLICGAFSLYVLGAFSANRDLTSEGGLGYYSANINALINSQKWSSILPAFSLATDGQYEGYAYLGLGALILFAFSILFIFYYIATRRNISVYNAIYLALIFSVSYILALSPTITLGKNVLVELQCRGMLKKILDMFRATGRFMWPAIYDTLLLITICFGKLEKMIQDKKLYKYGVIIFLFLLIQLQIIDLKPILFVRHNVGNAEQYSSKDYNALQSSFWKDIAEDYSHIEMMEDEMFVHINYYDSFSLAQYAVENGMTISNFAAARPDIESRKQILEEQMQKINAGEADEKTIYVFGNLYDLLGKSIDLNLYQVDGIVIGLKRKIDSLYDNVIPYNNSVYNVDLSDFNAYTASDVIEKDGSLINSGDNSEYVLYGPYTHISEGTYRLTLKYHYIEYGGAMDFIDIVSDAGTKTYVKEQLSQFGTLTISNIALSECNDYEIRVYVNQGNIISIDSLCLEYCFDT